jgi:hypothetical protein
MIVLLLNSHLFYLHLGSASEPQLPLHGKYRNTLGSLALGEGTLYLPVAQLPHGVPAVGIPCPERPSTL